MAAYRVLRHHDGDRAYAPGDTREAAPADVAHLVALGVLAPLAAAGAKAEPPLRDKADRAPRNKAR